MNQFCIAAKTVAMVLLLSICCANYAFAADAAAEEIARQCDKKAAMEFNGASKASLAQRKPVFMSICECYEKTKYLRTSGKAADLIAAASANSDCVLKLVDKAAEAYFSLDPKLTTPEEEYIKSPESRLNEFTDDLNAILIPHENLFAGIADYSKTCRPFCGDFEKAASIDAQTKYFESILYYIQSQSFIPVK
ncbi:MAG: hypothetical protein EYC62_08990 [Alphaproteobacteria bacterium]|nr:MAG: hypothetical protein EYC62_08990 [Alphaproteobacteria bacterium]